ncbi:MAG TPA: methyltransferase regulatory domain-containing protein [Bryobacteraceae bacterium]|nr:methyltransferase regulatory domain-containing protein [Bryobacteraceae bacterium]
MEKFKLTHYPDFDAAAGYDFPGFDYIVSHGVYTWVNPSTRQSWRRFIDRHLKPGGLVYVSYNALPGRAADLPLQRLVRALGRSMPGNSQEQVAAALGVVDSLTDMKAPALVSSPFATGLREHRESLSLAYLAHEFMGADWEPLSVTDVRADLADIGLKPAGSATLMQNYDGFVLGRVARESLATIGDADARELARDFLIDQFFRRDVFIRDGGRLDENERRRRLLESTFFLSQPAAKVEYGISTSAGHLSFDNAAARHIVKALAAGPRRLADIAEATIPDQNLLANALTLCASLAIWPVESNRVPVANLNAAIYGRLGGAEEIHCVALPFGTALAVDRDQLVRLRDGATPSIDERTSWVQLQMSQL